MLLSGADPFSVCFTVRSHVLIKQLLPDPVAPKTPILSWVTSSSSKPQNYPARVCCQICNWTIHLVEDKVPSPNACVFLPLFFSFLRLVPFLVSFAAHTLPFWSLLLFFSLLRCAVFLHAPSACVLVLAVQVLSAALFLFLSLCCQRRCNVFHG